MSAPDPLGVGVIGCGAISTRYLETVARHPVIALRALADRDPAAAERQAARFGARALSVDALLADASVALVLNLTVPQAHAEVSLAALAAGKHVHSEKPLGVSVAEGRAVLEGAAGLRVGCAPDTFLGGAQQTARGLLDAGAIGRPVGGLAAFLCPGHEGWHPEPGFYYRRGGGPMLDMGPYYVTALVNLLGPVATVSGEVSSAHAERVVTSAPRAGTRIAVEVPTHVAGTLRFASGALVQLTTSFDVGGLKGHRLLEIHGIEGTMVVPDPNHFGGEVEILRRDGSRETHPPGPFAEGDHRGLGAAELTQALRAGRPHRADGVLALHVLEVMEAFGRSAEAGRRVAIASPAERPAPMTGGPERGS